MVVDPERELYAAWGLGEASALAAVSPWTIWRAYKLGTEEGIWCVLFLLPCYLRLQHLVLLSQLCSSPLRVRG